MKHVAVIAGSNRKVARARVCAAIAIVLLAIPPAMAGSAAAVPATLSGVYESVIADDLEGGRSERWHFLRDTASDKAYRLRFAGDTRVAGKSGRIVTLRGRLEGDTLFVEQGIEMLTADGLPTESTATADASVAAVSGDQRTLVVLGNFRDRKLTCTTQQVQDMVFTDPNKRSVAEVMKAASQGRVTLSGTTEGPYDIDFPADASCDLQYWAEALDAKVKARGIDVSTYDRAVYVLPLSYACPGNGFGGSGGQPARAWVMSCNISDVYLHELGHTFGLDHASTPTGEYGDGSDFMSSGGIGLRMLNAPHYEDLGWRSTAVISEVTASGTFDVAPLAVAEASALAPQVLKVRKPDTGEYYYLSYRTLTGYDANLYSEYANKVSVHRAAGTGTQTFQLAALAAGAAFRDTANSMEFSVTTITPDYATVRIGLGGSPEPTCTRLAPVVSLSPASQEGAAGTSLTYTLAVKNTDSAGCGASSFAVGLANALPQGWAATLSPSSLSLSPGSAGTATVKVASAAAAPSGAYAFSLRAADASVSAHAATATAEYRVASACVAQPPALVATPTDQQANAGTSRSYSVTVTNRDGAGCPQAIFDLARTLPDGWSGSLSSSSVTLGPGQAAGVSVSVTSPSSASLGTYGVKVEAVDAANSLRRGSAAMTYTVQAAADTAAPTVPGGLSASVDAKRKRVTLQWSPATDDVGVAAYRVWRDGVNVGQSAGTWYLDGGLSAGATYTYAVSAVDAAGNESARSAGVTVVLPSGGNGASNRKDR